MLQFGENTEVWRNIPKMPGKPALQMRRERFTDSYTKWSPQGTFLASMHRQGVLLWAGKPLDKAPRAKLPHQDVAYLDFSPQERFAFTRREPVSQSDPQVWAFSFSFPFLLCLLFSYFEQ